MSWVIHKAKIVRPTTCMEKEASDFRCFVVGLPFSMTPDDIKMGKLRCVCRLDSTLSLFFPRSAVDISLPQYHPFHILKLTLQRYCIYIFKSHIRRVFKKKLNGVAPKVTTFWREKFNKHIKILALHYFSIFLNMWTVVFS